MKLETLLETPTTTVEVEKKRQHAKTLEYVDGNGKERVYDVHRYSDKGVLYFKKN